MPTVRHAAATLVAAAILAAPPGAAAAGPYGVYRVVDPIQRPPSFTVRLLRPGAACRRVAHTHRACFTIRQAHASDLIGVGRLTVSGRRLGFRDGVTGACPDRTGHYTWRRVGHRLRLTVLGDNCAGRRHLFTARAWRSI